MSKRNNSSQKAGLARAIAAGCTIKGWAAKNQVNPRTAYKWARQPEVLAQVEAIQRRAMGRTIGRLSRHAIKVADRLDKLAVSAASETVRLAANRAILADLIAATDHAQFEARIAELERRARAQQPDPTPGTP